MWFLFECTDSFQRRRFCRYDETPNVFPAYISVLLYGFLHQTTSEYDNELDDPEFAPKSCDTYAFLWVKGIVKSLLKCLSGRSTFKLKNIFELGTRASCLLKCTLQEEGAIGRDGILDDVAAAIYFDESFDRPVIDIAMPDIQSCFGLARDFNPKEYWCKSYLPFVECCLSAILKGFIPYVGDCISSPTLGILFSTIKYLAPESEPLTRSMKDLRRSMTLQKKNHYTCFNKNCTRLYQYTKVNGTKTFVIYNQDLEVISVERRNGKKSQSQNQNQGQRGTNNMQNNKPKRRWWQRRQQNSNNYNNYNNYNNNRYG